MELLLNKRLDELKKSLDRLQSLCAWRNLKKAEEKPEEPPSFRMHDPTEQDIKVEFGFFQKASIELRNFLPNYPFSEQKKIREWLTEMEKRVRSIIMDHQTF